MARFNPGLGFTFLLGYHFPLVFFPKFGICGNPSGYKSAGNSTRMKRWVYLWKLWKKLLIKSNGGKKKKGGFVAKKSRFWGKTMGPFWGVTHPGFTQGFFGDKNFARARFFRPTCWGAETPLVKAVNNTTRGLR